MSNEKLGSWFLAFIFLLGMGYAARSLLVWEYGYFECQKMKNEVEAAQEKVDLMDKKIMTLNEQIDEWKTNGFVFEKALREDLLMSQPEETVFYVVV